MYARPFIDSLDFAANGKQIDAQVPFAELLRLQDVLADTQGSLHYTVQGGLDYQGRSVLDISMDGTCHLICQRCLNGLDYEIVHEARLLLCDQATLDELDSDRQPDEEEEIEVILADAHLDVLALLEDEILLTLPISPMHDSGVCQVTEGEDAQKGKRNPFAVLENLKRN
jgi:uncharacterized protein